MGLGSQDDVLVVVCGGPGVPTMHGEVVANDQGSLLTPSCIAFTSVERFVGDATVNQAALVFLS